MFESIGKNVIFLRRIQIGEIRLGGISRGEYIQLNTKEIKYLNSLKKQYLGMSMPVFYSILTFLPLYDSIK